MAEQMPWEMYAGQASPTMVMNGPTAGPPNPPGNEVGPWNDYQQQQPTDRGALATGIQGFAQGITGNFADEIDAGLTAAHLNPFSSPQGDGIADSYNKKLAYNREMQGRDIAAHPVANLAGTVGGALALTPVLPAISGETLVAKAGQSALQGAGMGSAYGFGGSEGDIGDRFGDAAKGAVIGGVTGGAVPVVTDAIIPGAVNWLKGVKPSTQTAIGDLAGGIDDVGHIKNIQNVINQQHDKVSAAEDALWGQVRKESAASAVPVKQTPELVKYLLDAQADMTSNEAAGMVDRQIARINRFVNAGQDIPANEVIGMRKTLSKAAQKDGGLWNAVKGVDQFIANNLNVPSLPKAIGASRGRFQVFDNQKAVASAIAEDATPEAFGRVLLGASSPANAPKAAQFYDQVVTAAGKQQAPQVQQMLDQSVAHRILQVARQNDGDKVWIGKAANEITNLRMKNPSLWGKLSPTVQDGLTKLETTFRKQGEAGSLNKAGNFALELVSKGIHPFGISTNLHLPSVIAPKQVTSVDEIIKLLGTRAAQPTSALTSPAVSAATAAESASPPPAGTFTVRSVSDPSIFSSGPKFQEPPPFAPSQQNQPHASAAPLASQVIAVEEGRKPYSYKDTTGNRTVGVGFNMDQPNAPALWKRAGVTEPFDAVYNGTKPLSSTSIDRLNAYTTQTAQRAAQRLVSGYDKLGENQKAALTSLALQLGGKEFSKFKVLDYLKAGNAKAVENSLLNTKVAEQSPARIKRQALMLAYDMSHEQADRLLASQGRISPNQRKYI